MCENSIWTLTNCFGSILSFLVSSTPLLQSPSPLRRHTPCTWQPPPLPPPCAVSMPQSPLSPLLSMGRGKLIPPEVVRCKGGQVKTQILRLLIQCGQTQKKPYILKRELVINCVPPFLEVNHSVNCLQELLIKDCAQKDPTAILRN